MSISYATISMKLLANGSGSIPPPAIEGQPLKRCVSRHGVSYPSFFPSLPQELFASEYIVDARQVDRAGPFAAAVVDAAHAA